MREEIVKLENNTSIHILGAELPAWEKKEFRRETSLASDLHLHNEYEFLKVNRGEMRCVTLEREFTLLEGDILFVNKYVPHSTYYETDHTHSTLLQFRLPSESDSIFRYVSRFKSLSDTPLYLFKSDADESAEIQSSVEIIVKEYLSKKPFWNDYVYNQMLMLLTSLKRQGITSEGVGKRADGINKLRPVLEYIDESFGEGLSTSVLSTKFSFNEQYFCRLFKSIVGTSPMNYINFVRVCKAEKLLKSGLSLLEIANEVGFSSLSYFNRVFKKFKHYSPSEYRRIINTRGV